MSTTRSRPGAARTRLAPADREEQIVQGAIRYFAEVGFGGQTRELSRRLGVTQPLLYRYFPSKQALIDRVYDEVFLSRWDPRWETLLEDRSRPLRERLIDFYQHYTQVIYKPEWIRLYMYSGLANGGFNKRYIARLEKLIFGRICTELRAMLELPKPEAVPLKREEYELVWTLHASIFYYGVRKFIYRIPVHAPPETVIALTVDETLVAAPAYLDRLLAPSAVARNGRGGKSGKGKSGKGKQADRTSIRLPGATGARP